MVKFAAYETDGKKLWRVSGYLGVDALTGRQKNVNKGKFVTKKEAQMYFNRLKLEFEEGTRLAKPKRMTYQEVFEEWFETYQRDVEESTAHKTKQIFNNHILHELDNMFIDRILPRHLQKLINKWHEKYKMHRTIYNYMGNVFKFAKFKRYIKDNPQDLVLIPKKKLDYKIKEIEKKFYTRSELFIVLDALSKMKTLKWLAFFRLLSFTGIRRGEALALTYNDINFKEGKITINKALALRDNNEMFLKIPKSNAGKREISVDEKTLEILKEWKHEQAETLIGFGFNAMKKNQLVWSKWESNTHLNLSSPRNAFMRVCEKHDIEPIAIHGFRRTHATLCIQSGIPMKELSKRLGHTDIQTTMNYYVYADESEEKTADRFANYLNF